MTYEEYVEHYGMSKGEFDKYSRQVQSPPGHSPSDRAIANPFNNYLITQREWCETYPAMRWLRQTEQNFDEDEIQKEIAGHDAIADYFEKGGPNMSSCSRYFRFEEGDIDIPLRTIDPEGYDHYELLRDDEDVLKALMRSMKEDEDKSKPSPRTAAALRSYATERCRDVDDRSRSREENRNAQGQA